MAHDTFVRLSMQSVNVVPATGPFLPAHIGKLCVGKDSG